MYWAGETESLPPWIWWCSGRARWSSDHHARKHLRLGTGKCRLQESSQVQREMTRGMWCSLTRMLRGCLWGHGILGVLVLCLPKPASRWGRLPLSPFHGWRGWSLKSQTSSGCHTEQVVEWEPGWLLLCCSQLPLPVFYLTRGGGSTSVEWIAACWLDRSLRSSLWMAVKYSLIVNIHEWTDQM